MRIHFFQHDAMEGIGTLDTLLSDRGWTATHTFWHQGDTPPDPSTWDLLIVMGGPMNIYEDDLFPWLVQEKAYLDRCISQDRPILGVCLGAQLLADRLGGPVTRNPHSEIGWSQLAVNPSMRSEGALLESFPETARVFQWHGDTFACPPGAISVGRTEACENQGFVKGNSIGLQFHLELDPASLRGLIEAQDKFEGPYVQRPEVFLADLDGFRLNRNLLGGLLDKIASRIASR